MFDRIGLFDEELVRNQDDEFNLRLIRNGGRILLSSRVVCRYYTRDTLPKLWRMYYQYGYFKPLVVRRSGVMTLRRLMPPLFVLCLAAYAAFGQAVEPPPLCDGGWLCSSPRIPPSLSLARSLPSAGSAGAQPSACVLYFRRYT